MQSLQSEPLWLPTEVVVKINLIHTAALGENHALLFPEKLEGAMMRPRNLWDYEEPDAVSLAVLYMHGIASAHAFEQGNKRTGFDAGFAFLGANGLTIHPEADTELMGVSFIALIERTITTADFEAHLSEYIVPIDI